MRINIHYKIFLILTALFAITFFGIYQGYKYLYRNLEEENYQRIKENLLRELFLAKSLLQEAIAKAEDGFDYDGFADDIGSSLTSVRVTIIDINGKVIGDSALDGEKLSQIENHIYRPEIQEALTKDTGASRRFSTTTREDMLYVATIFQSGNKGIIRLSTPLTEIENISVQMKKILVPLLFGFFVIIIFISLFVSFYISKPVRKISQTALEISKGDFSKKSAGIRNDEIGDLARAIDDMSEQIRNKLEEINSTKSRLEAVLLSMSEGVMVVDSKGIIILMNQSLKNFLAVQDQPIGRKPIEVLRNVEVQNIVNESLKHDACATENEINVLLPDEKIFLVHASPIKQEGKSEGAVLVFHEITALRRLERVRQDFVANVSHELRTPLSSIKGYTETLIDGALNDEENAATFLKTIHSESERLSNLIDDLLSLSRIESSKIKMSLAPCDIYEPLKQSIATLEKHASEKKIPIEISIPDNLPKVLGDETRLSQIFFNLIDNAIKYSQENRKIKISAHEAGKFIQVDIEDNGIGIPENDLSRIFERFYRVDKARSREMGGTGLGLSIVKHIVQAHGGEVWVKSALGAGSTFSFTIPKA